MFNIGKTYSFKTKAPSILGGEYKNQRVISIMGYDSAIRLSDVRNTHNSLIPIISGLTVSVELLTFYEFQDNDNTKKIFAGEWIDGNTIITSNAIDILVTIPGQSTQEINIITSVLNKAGFTNFNITTKDTV